MYIKLIVTVLRFSSFQFACFIQTRSQFILFIYCFWSEVYLWSLFFYSLRCDPGCRVNFLGAGDCGGDSDNNQCFIFIKVSAQFLCHLTSCYKSTYICPLHVQIVILPFYKLPFIWCRKRKSIPHNSTSAHFHSQSDDHKEDMLGK